MILVFILLGISIFTLLLFLILILSTIKVRIENLQIGKNMEQKKYQIIIEVYFADKIKILKTRFNNKKLRKIYNSKKMQEIDLKKIEKNIPINMISLKILSKVKIEKLDLQIGLGTENAVLTSYAVSLIAGLIGTILPHVGIKNHKKYFYDISPVYAGINTFNMYLDSIISIKIVHIIYIIYSLGMKKARHT